LIHFYKRHLVIQIKILAAWFLLFLRCL